MQLYAYDVLDEGADRVVELVASSGADVLLLGVSYCDSDIELTRGRGGDLPHNPRRSRDPDGAVVAHATRVRLVPACTVAERA